MYFCNHASLLRLGFLFFVSVNSFALASNQTSISLSSGCHNHISFKVQWAMEPLCDGSQEGNLKFQTGNGTIVRWFSRRQSESSNWQRNHCAMVLKKAIWKFKPTTKPLLVAFLVRPGFSYTAQQQTPWSLALLATSCEATYSLTRSDLWGNREAGFSIQMVVVICVSVFTAHWSAY